MGWRTGREILLAKIRSAANKFISEVVEFSPLISLKSRSTIWLVCNSEQLASGFVLVLRPVTGMNLLFLPHNILSAARETLKGGVLQIWFPHDEASKTSFVHNNMSP